MKPKKTKAISEASWQKIHAAYLATPGESPPDLRAFARRFGVRLIDLDDQASTFSWELEWKAAQALSWYREHGLGARTEAEFCARFEERTEKDPAWVFGGLTSEMEPDGVRALRRATALELWWRIMPPVFELEARRELDRTQSAVEALRKERNRLRREGGYFKPDVCSRDLLERVA